MLWSARHYTLDGIFRPRHPGQERRANLRSGVPPEHIASTLICLNGAHFAEMPPGGKSTIGGGAPTDVAEMQGRRTNSANSHKRCEFPNWRTALMRSEARITSRGWNLMARWRALTIDGETPCRSTSGSQRRVELAADEAANSVTVETGDEIGPTNATAPINQGEDCALLIEQLRADVCRWPLWDSWGKMPPVDERYYCGARCSSTYCSEHARRASQLERSGEISRRRAKR
jgi:hypothetical protein